MLTKSILIIAISFITCTSPSPMPSKKDATDSNVLYDQRQEGEWNVRADLDNFVVLIIPTPTMANTPSSPGLLDFLTKSLPKGAYMKRIKHVKKQNPDAAEETMHFIESKTAPYHVDISQSKLRLGTPTTEEALITVSPSAALVKSHPDFPVLNPNHKARSSRSRTSRAFVFTVPEEDFVVTKTEDVKKVVKKDGKKKASKDASKHQLRLVGAENEQCGPGLVRDSYGICRTYKKYF